MSIGSVGSSFGFTQQMQSPFGGSGNSKGMSKSDLVSMQSQISKMGGSAPKGMDKLISNFDKYAGDDGALSKDEMSTFAKDNGIELPSGPPPQLSGSQGFDLSQLSGGSKKKKNSDGSDSDSDDDSSNSILSALKKLVSKKYSQNSNENNQDDDLTKILMQSIQA